MLWQWLALRHHFFDGSTYEDMLHSMRLIQRRASRHCGCLYMPRIYFRACSCGIRTSPLAANYDKALALILAIFMRRRFTLLFQKRLATRRAIKARLASPI